MRTFLLLTLAITASAAGGCANLRLPRIDPTGERIFIWPKDQPQTVPPPSSAIVEAPPATTDPFFPTGAVPGGPILGAPIVDGAPAAVLPPGQIVVDKVTITPERVLAPIGSEVVLKSGICTTDGFLLANQKIEWMLGRNGVGQFVELGGKGWIHPPLLPWNKSKKVDNYYAVGYAASGPLCITRGTPDLSDDVPIRRGESWATVTSPVEGVSHVTSLTPQVESWPTRRAEATIYWVDVQWTFPPQEVVNSGGPEQLTTTVTRQSDGLPLEGWIVRYTVNDGVSGATGTGTVLEERTGPDGRASVQVSPTDTGAPRSRIDVQLIRPANIGGLNMPELVVGNGTTLIQWGDGVPYVPPGDFGAAPPGGWTPPEPTDSFPQQIPQPDLEVRATRVDGLGDQLRVGDSVAYEVEITNRGDGAADDVVLEISYSPGLYTPADLQLRGKITNNGPGRIEPQQTWRSQSQVVFQINESGQHYIDVGASSTTGNTTAQTMRYAFSAVDPPPVQAGKLEVSKVGLDQVAVGQSAAFRITVANTGTGDLTNIEIRDHYRSGYLQPVQASLPAGAQLDGEYVIWTIPLLTTGQRQEFNIECDAVGLTGEVRSTVEAFANSGLTTVRSSAEANTFIAVPPPGQPSGSGPASPGAQTPNTPSIPTGVAADFRRTGGDVVRVSNTDTLEIRVFNRNPIGGTADESVQVSVLLPPDVGPNGRFSVEPDMSQIRAPFGTTAMLDGSLVRFTKTNGLRPGSENAFLFEIPVRFTRTDVNDVVVRVESQNLEAAGVSPQVIRLSKEVTQ